MVFFILLLFGAATAYLAKRKNRNPVVWGILGFLFNIGAIGVILFLRPGNYAETANSVEPKAVEKITEKDISRYDQSILDSFKITDWVKMIIKNSSAIDLLGIIVAILITFIIAVSFTALGGVLGLLLCIMMLWKFNNIKQLFAIPGFGKGVLIYTAYIVVMCYVFIENILLSRPSGFSYAVLEIIFNIFKSNGFSYSVSEFLAFFSLGILWIIAGFFILPKVNKDAKKAAPFIGFLFSAGLLFLFANLRNNSSDISSPDVGIANTVSYDISAGGLENIDINSDSLPPSPMPVDIINTYGIEEPISDTTGAVFDNNSFAAANANENTVIGQEDYSSTNTTYQISDSTGMNQGHIINDGETAKIYDNENNLLGTITQDDGTSVLKDAQQNTIFTKDSSGFILTPDGEPIAHIEDGGSVETMRGTEAGEFVVRDEINGVIRDGHTGEILGRINKR